MASFPEAGDRAAHAPKPGGIAARAMGGVAAPLPYLDGLNPEQRRAVETLDGPVLVLAGAGTGKTRVLTTRIAHILATGRAFPSQILSVTFTNRAAREMRERISSLVGGTVEGMPWLGTFHSIGTKMLRRHAELVGLRSDFTILDTDDQLRLMKQVIQAENLDEKRWPARQLANLIDGWKNRALTPDAVPPGEGRAFGNGKGAALYATYQDRLTVLNAADFGDLLLLPIRVFKAHHDVLEDYRRRFRFMLVDEYQDTNIAQYLWLRLLAGSDANLCCVGDDDQSIYGWRGAEVDNILRFEQDFPGAAVIRLERNYRSTAPILACAAHLIAHNEGRLGKTLFTDSVDPDATPVTVASAWDSEEEARSIGEEIESLQRKGQSLNDVAILVRASFQMREFEDRFVTTGIPYRVIGGPRFYERLEIRDALAYLRATVQPADDLAFERIVNTPKRGLGDATMKLLHDTARGARIPLMQAARDIVETEELKPKARTSLRDLLTAFARWRTMNETMPHNELAEIILDESGYTEMWRQDRSADAPGRLDNLKELVRSMQGFETMGSFLEHVSLVMEAEEAGAETAKVTLMTLHAAKGLEYGTVFLPGWEEGLFPHQRALDESGRAGLEEERRLAYVGITRARKRAYVWFASNRRIHGLWQSTIPSRFLDELPEKFVEVREAQRYGGGGGYGQSRFDRDGFGGNAYATPGWERARARAQAAGQGRDGRAGGSGGGQGGGGPAGFGGSRGAFGSGRGNQGRGGFEPGPRMIEGELVAKGVVEGEARFAVGTRVFHQKFGNGNVTAVDGNKLTVSFDKAGVKRVLDSFVEPT